ALPAPGKKQGDFMLGIEAQANIVNTLLTGAWLNPAGPAANGAALALLTLICALLSYRLRVTAGAITAAALAIAWLAFAFIAFALHNVWLHAAAPVLGIFLAWGSVYAYRYGAEDKRRAFVQSMFGRYVSHDVMEELLDDPGKLAIGVGERVEITVFFSDINGFTSVSESRSPEEVIPMLNDYLEEMTRIVFAHRGTVKQYVGDEIMVLYGAPRKHPEPEKACIRMALDMVDRLNELAAQDPSGENGFYDVKMGIHTGNVVVGNIGSAQRTEYTAIGDTVNLASRIMGLTKKLGGTILISEVTRERVKDMPGVEFIFREKQEVRGRQNSIGIYEVRRAVAKEKHAS
ncbi:MAG: adenylate/guanylate cyclase domain-containing protein, partial [Armatimonadetes bacterium]|nr:adenylate/guanylate cyclase domain-containing protein [Armatimonadota bacterium]